MSRRSVTTALVALVTTAFSAPLPAVAAAPDRVIAAASASGAATTWPGLVNVALAPGAVLPAVPGVLGDAPLFPGGDPELARWLTLEVAPGTEERMASVLAALPQVAVAETVPVRVPAYEPNDPRRRDQWHLDRIAAGSAWNVARGDRRVRVGIVDTQFDRGHPELRGVLFRRDGRAGVDVYADGCRANVPYAEHGTLVAGVAAAATDNASGVASVGFSIGVVAAQAGVELSGFCAISPAWVRALTDMVDASVPVVNLSFASPRSSAAEAAAIRYATNHGTLVVAAAGNDATTTPYYPAADPLVVGVAATDSQDRLWSRSNRGAWVDLAAPGVSLLTLCPGGYCYATGTSTAAPVVAAVATVLEAEAPQLHGLQLRNRVLAAADEITGLAVDPDLGYGRVRLDRALTQRAVRLFGRDRVATARAIAREAHPVGSSGVVSRVVLVPSDTPAERGWTVTLPAAGLLADRDTAFVMTGRAALDAGAAAELRRLLDGDGEVVLPGSATTGVSGRVEQQLVDAGYRVQRLAGTDAATTATAIAERVVHDSGATAALVARGDTFADALSLTGPAAAHGYPLLFVGTDRVPAATCDWVRANPMITTLHLAGGTQAIAPAVEEQLRDCTSGLLGTRDLVITRDAGRSRVETAIAVARRHFGTVAPPVVALANGYSWPDAVTGGALVASHGAPVLTTAGRGTLEPAVRDYVAGGRTREAFVLGGRAAVDDAVASGLEAALR